MEKKSKNENYLVSSAETILIFEKNSLCGHVQSEESADELKFSTNCQFGQTSLSISVLNGPRAIPLCHAYCSALVVHVKAPDHTCCVSDVFNWDS